MESKFNFTALALSGSTKVTLRGEVFAQDAVIAANLARAVVEQQMPGCLIQTIKLKKVRK